MIGRDCVFKTVRLKSIQFFGILHIFTIVYAGCSNTFNVDSKNNNFRFFQMSRIEMLLKHLLSLPDFCLRGH